MKKRATQIHSVPALFSLLLFGLFTLFLLLMLLFSARAYQQETVYFQEEDSLGTASAYITAKFRQHDTPGGIFASELDGIPALCFRDTINDQDYTTYLYLEQNNLKELFAPADTDISSAAGTSIAELSDFQAESQSNGFYRIFLKSTEGTTSEFYLHQNSSETEAS